MRRRIVGVATAVTAMVVVAFALPLALTVRSLAGQAATDAAEARAGEVARDVGRALAAGTDLGTVVGDGDLGDGYTATVATDGQAYGATPSDPTLVTDAFDGTGVSRSTPDGIGVALPIAGTDGATIAVVAVETAADGGRETAVAWSVLAALSLLLIGLSAFVADRLAADLVRSVDELAVGAEALADGDLTARVDVGGPPEIATVAAALNQLGGRISALLRAEREEVADLAHQLRTPLTALRLETEGTRAEDAVFDLSRAVDEVITQARRPIVEADDATCDLARVVSERAAFWQALAVDEHRSLELDVPPGPVEVATDSRSVRSAVDALVVNVFEHTSPGTPIRISVDVAPPSVTVEDGGPGLPDDTVLARGIGGGTGLGLDIARRSVQAAGGRMEVFTSDLGGAGIRLRYA